MTTHELTYSDRSARLPSVSRWLPLPVVLAGTFMVVLDFFIVNVALPSIQSDLGASDSALEWVMGPAAVGGQLIGGALIAADPAGLGWRSCFLINVPVGVVGLLLAPRVIPESRQPAAPRLDRWGTALATAALTALVLPLLEGRQ